MENRTNASTRDLRLEAGETEYAHFLAGYESLYEGAALVDRSGRTILKLTGKDPIEMLNAILTNDVPKEETLGTYAALLNPKGRIQTDLRVLKANGGVLVDTERAGAQAAREILGRYAPFSRVEIENLSEGEAAWTILGLYGPRAGELLGDLRLTEHETMQVEIGGATLLAAGVAVPIPGFDLVGPAGSFRAAREYLAETGAIPADCDAYETARVAACVPRFGADITPENFPAEAGILERAVSFEKGCYPGQETVARMHYRGHPNKTLHRLTAAVEGPPPAPGTPIVQDGKQVGKITSAAPLPVAGRHLALGYLSRNARTDAPLSAGGATILLAS